MSTNTNCISRHEVLHFNHWHSSSNPARQQSTGEIGFQHNSVSTSRAATGHDAASDARARQPVTSRRRPNFKLCSNKKTFCYAGCTPNEWKPLCLLDMRALVTFDMSVCLCSAMESQTLQISLRSSGPRSEAKLRRSALSWQRTLRQF